MIITKKIASLIYSGYILILLLIMCIRCTPSQRMGTLLKKHPELIKRDSIMVHDSILVKASSYGSGFSDTLRTYSFHEKNNTITYVHDYIKGRDTIYVHSIDSVIHLHHYDHVNSILVEKHKSFIQTIKDKLHELIIISFILIVIFILFKLIKR